MGISETSGVDRNSAEFSEVGVDNVSAGGNCGFAGGISFPVAFEEPHPAKTSIERTIRKT